MFSIITLCIFGVTVNAPVCVADVFTSVQHMESLYLRESRLLDELDYAIHFFQETLDMLLKTRSRMSAWRGRRARENARGVAFAPDHPVDAFTLVRRLARDWPLAVSLMTHSYQLPEDLMDEMKEGEAEMGSALRGLNRLQTVYRLDTDQLADGIVRTAKADTTMTECDPADYFYFNSTLPSPQIPVVKKLPRLRPNANYERAHLYNLAARKDCSWHNESNAMEAVDMNKFYHKAYNEMCYGAPKIYPGSCYYVNYGQKPLIIAPFKMEEVHMNPPIMLVHDVISDAEIEEMKRGFLGVMVDCEVVHQNSSTLSTYRTCTRGWVTDDLTPVSARLSRRIGQLANLQMKYSEPHQIGSYGLGGEYKLHNDALHHLPPTEPGGQRIGTVMLYLNEVTAGGYTVFPVLDTAVAPAKGAAVFWFNMLPDSEPDFRTLHGGCPVLLGSKWVLNKWIREKSQEWITHCPAEEEFTKQYFIL